MSKSAEVAIPQFWHERLTRVAERPALCIVGYEFHSEYYMPHFFDTIDGVWSRPDGRINPFMSEAHYQTVMGWANWRKSIITKLMNPENVPKLSGLQSLNHLKKFQQLFSLKIADQSPDGLLKANMITGIYEIYGNIQHGRCHDCGNQVENWQFDSTAQAPILCQLCGGRIFPDIAMFGWNEQVEAKAKVTAKIAEAESLLLIAPDKTRFPFLSCADVIREKSVIELAPNSIILDHGKQVISLSDIVKILGSREGEMSGINNATGSLAETLAVFGKLCAAWHRSSA